MENSTDKKAWGKCLRESESVARQINGEPKPSMQINSESKPSIRIKGEPFIYFLT